MYRWLKVLGFKYETRKKYYFADGHEKDAMKKYRKKYVKKMLELERRMYRWTHLPKDEVKKYVKEYNLLAECGYHFRHPVTGEEMVEFHVDSCKEFQNKMNN